MSINTPVINSFQAANAYTNQTEQTVNEYKNSRISEQTLPSFQEEMNQQDKLQVAPDDVTVLDGKEKATLHALFGSEKPSEMAFYGLNQLQNIHRGQLLDMKG